MLPSDNRFNASNLTLLAICAGALLYFSAFIPDLIQYATDTALSDSSHTLIALAALAFVLLGMAFLYEKGHKFTINFVIIAMALSTPYVFDEHAFLNSSVPQGIWLPFIFAMAVSQFRDAVITLCISITLAFFTYQDAFRSPRALAETLLIFFLLLIGRLVLHKLAGNVVNEQNRTRLLRKESRDNKATSDLISSTMTDGVECVQLIYRDGIAVDGTYLKVNDAFEHLIGIKHITGSRISDVLLDNQERRDLLAAYTRVAATGVNEQHKIYRGDQWYQLTISSSVIEHCAGLYQVIKEEPPAAVVTTPQEQGSRHNIPESELNSMLEESGDAIWICDAEGHFIYTNSTASRLTGFDEEELTYLHLSDLIHEDREDELLEYLVLTKYARFAHHDWMLNHKNGSKVPVEITTGHLQDGRLIMIGRDLTTKIKTESERFKFFQIVETSPECIMLTNLDGEIEYVNAAFLKRTGYSRKELIGKNPRVLKSGKVSPQLFTDLWTTIKRGDTWQGEIFNISKNGHEYVQFTTVSPIRKPDGSIGHFISNGEDITERKRGEEKIFELAYFDPLTGLPNRSLLLDRLKQVIAISLRNNMFNALLFIDLDNFKNINDTLGHQHGDMILKQAAQSLMLRVREGDTVSRFGGDEFIVLLASLGTEKDVAAERAKAAAFKLLDSLNQTFQMTEIVHHSTASIGIAMFNGNNCTIDELLKQADIAMYEAKKAGKNTLRFFDPSLEFAMR